MAIGTVISKGLDIFQQAPKQVQKQIDEGAEQGIKYLEGRGVKRQEIDQLTDTTGAKNLSDPGSSYYTDRLPTQYPEITPPDVDENVYEEVGYWLPEGMQTQAATDAGDHWGMATTAHVRRDTKDGALRVFEIQSDPQNRLGKAKREINIDTLTEKVIKETPLKLSTEGNGLYAAVNELVTNKEAYSRVAKEVKEEKALHETIQSMGSDKVPFSSKKAEALEIADKVKVLFEERSKELRLSPYNINWDKDVINRQFVDAANQGLDKVDFLIKPEGDYMARSEKVQKNYETRVKKQIENLAKKLKGPNGEKATVEMITGYQPTSFADVIGENSEFALHIIADRIMENDHVPTTGEYLKAINTLEDIYMKQYDINPEDLDINVMHDYWVSLNAKPMVVTPEVLDALEVIEKATGSEAKSAIKGDQYLRVNLPKTAAGAVAAFSVPAFAEETDDSRLTRLNTQVARAKEAGITPIEMRQALGEKFDNETITQAITSAYSKEIEAARAGGVPEQELTAFLQEKGIIPMAPYKPDTALKSESMVMQGPGQNNAMTEATGAQTRNIFDDIEGSVATDQVNQDQIPLVEQQAPTEALDPNATGPSYAPTVIDTNLPPEQILADLRNIKSSFADSMYQVYAGLSDSKEVKAKAAAQKAEVDGFILEELNKRGVQAIGYDKEGQVLVQTQQGVVPIEEGNLLDLFEGIDAEVLTPGGMLETLSELVPAVADSLEPNKFELGGAIAGATAGAPGGPAGILLGGFLGAMAGRGTDVLSSANDLKYDLARTELENQMIEAGVLDLTFGALGYGIAGASHATIKGLSNAWDRVVTGNIDGAYEALKDSTNLNEAQIIDLLQKWDNAAGTSTLRAESQFAGQLTTRAEKETAIRVAGQTMPSLSEPVSQAADLAKKGGAPLAENIAERAKQIKVEADKVSSDTVTSLITQDLTNYRKGVENYFDLTKQVGIEKAGDFRFNFDPISSAVADLHKTQSAISNYALRQDFKTYLDRLAVYGKPRQVKSKVTVSGQAPEVTKDTSPRSFKDLLELRKVLNEFSSDTRFKNFNSWELINKAKAEVDKQIVQASKQMDGGEQWLQRWRKANTEYSKMKDLEANTLYKALSKPDISPEKTIRALEQSLRADDPAIVQQVFAKLTPRARTSAEGALFKHYLEKSTLQISPEQAAVNFPKLAQDLERYGFRSTEVKDLKRTVREFADVYKNDISLARIAWNSPAGRFKNNIATTIVGKAKMQFASYLFKVWQTVAPGNSSRRIALTMKMRKVLDNPLDAKSVEALKKALPNDPDLESQLHRMQIEYAKFGQKENYGQAKVYRVSTEGGFNKASNTSLGKGVMYYTDQAQARKIASQTGARVSETNIVPRRVAQQADIDKVTRELFGRPAKDADYRNQEVLDMLRHNFDGITKDTRVLMFKD